MPGDIPRFPVTGRTSTLLMIREYRSGPPVPAVIPDLADRLRRLVDPVLGEPRIRPGGDPVPEIPVVEERDRPARRDLGVVLGPRPVEIVGGDDPVLDVVRIGIPGRVHRGQEIRAGFGPELSHPAGPQSRCGARIQTSLLSQVTLTTPWCRPLRIKQLSEGLYHTPLLWNQSPFELTCSFLRTSRIWRRSHSLTIRPVAAVDLDDVVLDALLHPLAVDDGRVFLVHGGEEAVPGDLPDVVVEIVEGHVDPGGLPPEHVVFVDRLSHPEDEVAVREPLEGNAESRHVLRTGRGTSGSPRTGRR